MKTFTFPQNQMF